MRNALQVSFHLDRLVCYDEADGWGSAEPYMWTVFFKIDGTTCRLNDSLMLEGTATVFTTPGSHGNLGDTDVDAGDTVTVPGTIGDQTMTLTPIPVPDWVKATGTDDVTAIAGCIVVLMEEDNVSDDGAESGHRSLNSAVQNALDSLIPTLGFANQEISDDDINALTDQVQSKVEDAVKNQQNFFENLWSWLNPDDTIGTVTWKFSGDTLLNNNPTPLQQRWPNEKQPSSDNGDWELFGTITTEELPSCPADVASDIFNHLFGNDSSEKTVQALYRFRDGEMRKYAGLNLWWQIARNSSLPLKHILQDKEIAGIAFSVFKEIPALLRERDRPIPDTHFEHVTKVLHYLSTATTKSRQQRKDIKRVIHAVSYLKGKTPAQIFHTLSAVRPARYPSLNVIKEKE